MASRAAGGSDAVEEARPGSPPTHTQEVKWPPSLPALSEGPSILTLVLTFTISTSLTMAKLRVVYRIISSMSKTDFGMFNMVVAICLLISGTFGLKTLGC